MAISFHQRTLSNGLTVIGETNPEAHTAAVGYFVKTGSRDEPSELMGVSHFLEHMMFKGTARRSADDVNREFDEIGANYNAFTSQELTVYFAQVLPEFFGRAVDLLGDMMRPALREDDFNMEKNVILEEIGMYEDRPYAKLHDLMLETHFDGHPLSYRVLGTNDSVSALQVDQMRGYFAQRYSADNITVAATGAFDFDRFVDDVAGLTEAWRPTRAARQYEDPALRDREHSLVDGKLTRQYIDIICPAPSAQDDGRYAALVLADTIGDSDGSRLYWSLVDPGLADEADFTFYPQDRIGSFVGYASCVPGRAKQVERTFLSTLDDYGASICGEEIERAKNKIATQVTLRSENPLGRMRSVAGQWLFLGDYIPLDQEIERIMAVTPDHIRSLLEHYTFRPRTVVRYGPGPNGD